MDSILEQQDEENTTSQKTIRIINKQGNLRWLHATFTSVSYNNKPAIAASAQDITLQIKTERILLKAERRGFALQWKPPISWSGIMTPKQIVSSLNPTPSTFPFKNYPEYFGFNTFLRHVDPRDKQRALHTLKAIRNTNKRFEIDFRILVEGGESEWWHMEGRSYAAESNRPARIIGTSRCIQSQKKAREVIKKKEDLIRFQADLLANIGQMIIAQNTKGEIVYWNEEAKKLVGEYADDSLPFDPDKYIPSQYRIIHNEEIMQSLYAGQQWSGERKAYLLDGEIIPLHVNVSPFRDKKGELEGFIIIGTDLTKYKKIQAELRASQEQLQLQMHQLQAIYTMAEIMKEAEDLTAIYKAASDGISVVSDINRVAILMLDDNNQLSFTFSQNLPEHYQAILLEHCMWVNDTQSREDIYISNVQSSSTCDKLAQSFLNEGISSLAAISLVTPKQNSGQNGHLLG